MSATADAGLGCGLQEAARWFHFVSLSNVEADYFDWLAFDGLAYTSSKVYSFGM